jgi:hypothetical protein
VKSNIKIREQAQDFIEQIIVSTEAAIAELPAKWRKLVTLEYRDFLNELRGVFEQEPRPESLQVARAAIHGRFPIPAGRA